MHRKILNGGGIRYWREAIRTYILKVIPSFFFLPSGDSFRYNQARHLLIVKCRTPGLLILHPGVLWETILTCGCLNGRQSIPKDTD